VFELCYISNNSYSLFDSRALTARSMKDNETRCVGRFPKGAVLQDLLRLMLPDARLDPLLNQRNGLVRSVIDVSSSQSIQCIWWLSR
jgi:hypothetical protein